jgi:hypothetical protein
MSHDYRVTLTGRYIQNCCDSVLDSTVLRSPLSLDL